MQFSSKLKDLAKQLKMETATLYFVARDQRTPWYTKMVIGCVVAYALSPIDLVPDFIPVLGYLDDLLILPLGIYVALKMTPDNVLADARQQAQGHAGKLPRSWIAAIVIVVSWCVAMIFVGILVARFIQTETQTLIGG